MPSLIDEYTGHGGEYLLDPKTGKRTLISRTEPAQPAAPDEALNDAIALSETPDSGDDGIVVRDKRPVKPDRE